MVTCAEATRKVDNGGACPMQQDLQQYMCLETPAKVVALSPDGGDTARFIVVCNAKKKTWQGKTTASKEITGIYPCIGFPDEDLYEGVRKKKFELLNGSGILLSDTPENKPITSDEALDKQLREVGWSVTLLSAPYLDESSRTAIRTSEGQIFHILCGVLDLSGNVPAITSACGVTTDTNLAWRMVEYSAALFNSEKRTPAPLPTPLDDKHGNSERQQPKYPHSAHMFKTHTLFAFPFAVNYENVRQP